VLLELRGEGRDLYSVAMKRPGPSPLARALGGAPQQSAAFGLAETETEGDSNISLTSL
jgi:hypothetical protein